jgi:phospholipase/carboxylesterase
MAAPTLLVLLHGVGQGPAGMAPLARRIAACDQDTIIAAPPAAHPYDRGTQGHQWFSVAGIDEENRPGRIRAALPAFIATIHALQREHGAGPERTVLAGFSQGAIMALAGSGETWLARHVIAIAGRFAPLPQRWDARTAVSLVHGRMDGVVPADRSRQAAARLEELGAQVGLALVPRAVHQLSPAILDAALEAWRSPPSDIPATPVAVFVSNPADLA